QAGQCSAQAAFFLGTLAPFSRASERPMAMACFRLVTFPPLPPLPERSVPCFFRRIALATVLPAPLLYLRPLDFFFASIRYSCPPRNQTPSSLVTEHRYRVCHILLIRALEPCRRARSARSSCDWARPAPATRQTSAPDRRKPFRVTAAPADQLPLPATPVPECVKTLQRSVRNLRDLPK